MANTNPGGVDLNSSPYFDDYDEDKKFVRVLYVPGRAVQARELTQMQTLQQVQMRRFAEYFFKQGAIVDGCEQNLDVNLDYVKLQATYNGAEVDVTDFEGKFVFGANTGIKAYSGIVSDIEGTDPKTLFINYQKNGAIVLTTNTAPATLVPGNTITFLSGNTATIDAGFVDPITGTCKILVSNVVGTLTTTTASTVSNTGSVINLNVTAVTDKRANTAFDSNETVFTEDVATRSYAQSATTRATSTVVDEGLATEKTYTKGAKVTVSEGVVFLSDHFVKHDTQTVVLDKYTNQPSYKVGIVPTKSFIDYLEDSSLVDNAQGTPNFQAPGADRFKIDTVLTKVALDAVTDENEFITLLEVENGIARKRKLQAVESKLEDALAQRTFEESGDYAITDPVVTVREHLLQANNGGRYSSEEGGNTSLLLLEVDPFTCYVSGYRNQLIARTPVDLTKGLATEFIEQTKTQINYGQYIQVKEVVGAWDFMEGTVVDLYDTAQQVITANTFSTATVTGSKIGEARVRAIEYINGTQGTPGAVYNLYLYEVTMNSGQVFSSVRSVYDSATPKRFADAVLDTSGRAVLNETSFNSLIFPLAYNAVKTIRDDQENIETGFRFKKKFSVTFSSGVATIATTDSTENFVGTGLLSSNQKDEFYQIVINNAGANVETTSLSGTVTVGAASASVVGTSTSFTSQVNVGDILKINNIQLAVASITNNTFLTLTSAHSTGATANTFTKILPTGTYIPMSGVGGSGASRTINVSSPGTVVIDLKESATFTAEVFTTMDRSNAREKRKTLVYQATANVNPSTHPNNTAGPFGLGYADIYRVHAVYQSADFSTPATTSDTNVTANYTLDNGQRDFAYEHGTVTPKPGITPTGRLLVVFDHFTHDTTQGLGYSSVDSYPVNDSATSNTTISTSNIPVFTSPITSKIYNLRDSIDFRPIKAANTSLNPIDTGLYQVPTGGLHIPKPTSDFDADLIQYKGRIVKVYINSRGVFGINEGVPPVGSRLAQTPPKLPDTLELAEITVPPYPSQPKDVRIKLLKNRRFTMRDIGKINERVEKLEYFTALNFLEKQASEKTELDADGLDRFKNGILVDPFTGFAVSNVLSSDWAAAIDKTERYLTCLKDNANVVGVRYSTAQSTTSLKDGGKIMLPYTQEAVPGLTQSYASRQLRLAEELNFIWTGEMTVTPFGDNYVETSYDPEQNIVYDDTGDADNWRALTNAWNSEVAPLREHWLGGTQRSEEIAGSRQTTTQGNFNVTSAAFQTTQEVFNQLAGGSLSSSPKQTVTGDRVVNISVALKMRSRDFIIHATGLKDQARLYAFFDGIDVTTNCKQIQLTGTKTLAEIDNENYSSTGILSGAGVDYNVIADGSLSESFRVTNNEIYLVFRVPASTFNVGQREFRLTDSPTNAEGTTLTSARQTIFAQGVSQVKSQITINSRPFNVSFNDSNNIRVVGRRVVSQQRVEIARQEVPPPPPPRNWDPVSQSFFVDSESYPQGFYVTSIDLFFRTKSADDNRNVMLEIREMINGFPGPQAIGVGDHAIVNNRNIQISEDASLATTFTFRNPIYLAPGGEYCFTTKPENNDPDYAIWVAELGAIDVTNTETETRIESAYNTGVLFTSSNDRTWTPRQNLDVKFTMRIANFGTTSKTAIFNNIESTSDILYDIVHPFIGDQTLPGTNIVYEIKTADSSYLVDESYREIKNFERLQLPARKQITNSTTETSTGFKSLQLRATLSTTNQYISPYIDNENIGFGLTRNIINNSLSTAIDGTVTFNNGSNIVVGSGTDFANDVFVGEYAYFGDEYRRVESVSNNTYLTVSTNFTTSNAASQTITIRNEENPFGPYSSDSRYITRVVTLNDGFEAADLVTYLRVNRPPGTGIRVYCKLLNENDSDSFDDKFYTEMSLDGTETFTLNADEFKEEKYIVPSGVKTGGSELLAGTVSVSNVSTTVSGTSTRFTEDLKIGDTIAVGTARTERVVATISNNTSLTVESAFSTVASSQDIYRVLNNEVAYTTPDGRTFNGYKYFAIKIVFISSNPNFTPKVKDLRAIALA
jgi:hypothetical protein